MQLSVRAVKTALLNKLDCAIEETHHHYYVFRHNGVVVVKTRMSHSRSRDINDFLIGKMAKQLCVTKPFFQELVSCTKSQDDFVEALREIWTNLTFNK